jgi:hypothetical protein
MMSASRAQPEMSAAGVTVATVVIMYAAELEAPALRETARRILEAEIARRGIPLDPAEVPHIMAAARRAG